MALIRIIRGDMRMSQRFEMVLSLIWSFLLFGIVTRLELYWKTDKKKDKWRFFSLILFLIGITITLVAVKMVANWIIG